MASSSLRKAVALTLRRAPHVIFDAAGFAGAGMIAYGAWLIFNPAGYLVGGALLLILSILFGRRLDAAERAQ